MIVRPEGVIDVVSDESRPEKLGGAGGDRGT